MLFVPTHFYVYKTYLEQTIILGTQEFSEICITLSNFALSKIMRKQGCSLHVQDNKFSEVLHLIPSSLPFLRVQHLWILENTAFMPPVWRSNLNVFLNSNMA